MKFSGEEIQFVLGAVDGVRCGSTVDARVKGQLLGKLAVELELREQQKKDVDDIHEVSDE